MQQEEAKVAIVTGASRGAGRGIALALGKKGMTVYVTGRSIKTGSVLGWDGSVLPGTVYETAEQINQAGGIGIAVVCDHSDDAQTPALFAQVEKEQGRLDILVNNAAFIHDQLVEQKPFWEKEIDAGKILDVGLRSAYVASWHGAKLMAKHNSGLIMFGSSFGASCYIHGPAYGAQKAGLDKLAHDMAVDFKGTGMRAVSIWMGPLLTERSAIIGKLDKEQYQQFMATAESPEFIGDIVYAIANDPKGDELNGHTVIAAEIAKRFNITDREGLQPPSYREMLGSPNKPNPAVIY